MFDFVVSIQNFYMRKTQFSGIVVLNKPGYRAIKLSLLNRKHHESLFRFHITIVA